MGKIFVSYRRKDADFAHRLAAKLEVRLLDFIFIDEKINQDNWVKIIDYSSNPKKIW